MSGHVIALCCYKPVEIGEF